MNASEPPTEAEARAARLAEQLRTNLRRRKAQARAAKPADNIAPADPVKD